MLVHRTLFVGLIFTSLLISGCGSHDKSSKNNYERETPSGRGGTNPPSPDPKKLDPYSNQKASKLWIHHWGAGSFDTSNRMRIIERELRELDNLDPVEIEKQDHEKYNRAFYRFFGGHDGAHYRKFIEDRVRNVFYSFERVISKTQCKTFTLDRQLNFPDIARAQNVGSSEWINSIEMNCQLTLVDLWNHEYPVDSTRSGLIRLGDDYLNSPAGISLIVQMINKQSTLGHEARHSDCPEGISVSQLQAIANLSFDEQRAIFEKEILKTCSYPHIKCPKGHDYSGIYACDNVPWGPYTVSWLYTGALSGQVSFADRSALNAIQMDYRTRLLFSVDAMLRGDLGEPDLKSQEFVP